MGQDGEYETFSFTNIFSEEDGEIIEGDENFIQNITDMWTFERALTSTNPNWVLVSTKK